MPSPSTARAPAERDDPLAPLLTGVLERDPAAIRRLLDGVAPDVVRVVKLVVGEHAPDVDDLAQEALLGLLRALPDFRGDCSLRRFARRVAARTAMASRRRAARRASHHERFVEGEVARAPSSPPDPAERRREVVRELLVELPPAQAEALVLRVVLEHSLEEIATATGVPLNTVRSRLRLAKEALRRRITDDPVLRELVEDPE
jgi:RNA polymerase sigma-70 factor (ECF subfamily)